MVAWTASFLNSVESGADFRSNKKKFEQKKNGGRSEWKYTILVSAFQNDVLAEPRFIFNDLVNIIHCVHSVVSIFSFTE